MKGVQNERHNGWNIAAGGLAAAGIALIGAALWSGGPSALRAAAAMAGLAALAAAPLLLIHVRRARRAQAIQAQTSRNEERLRLALEGARLGVFDWDIVSGQEYINPEWVALLGYSPQDYHSSIEYWKTQVHPADLPAALQAIERHLAGETPQYEAEYRLKTARGEWVWVLARGRVIERDRNNAPLRMAGTRREITAMKEAGDALKRRDAILAAVSLTTDRLLTSERWLDVLPQLLAGLGQALQANRAYVFAIEGAHPAQRSARKCSEWSSSESCPAPPAGPPQDRPLAEAGFGRWVEVLARGKILQGDVADFPPAEQAHLVHSKTQSLIEVPIFCAGAWWGLLGFDDCEAPHRWLPSDEDALRVAANVLAAAIARQQAADAEREEGRVAQEMLEMVTLFSRSLNFDSILDRLLEQLPRIVPFDAACILLVHGSWAYVARQRGYDLHSDEGYLAMSLRSYEIRQTPILAQLVDTQQVTIASPEGEGTLSPPGEISPYRSWIGAPLILQGSVSAILSIEKLEPGFYSAQHAARLTLFVSQASLALRNAQLFAETLQALEREQQMGEITRAISSELDLPSILQTVVRLAVEVAGAEAGSMSLLNANGDALAYPYLYNLPKELGHQTPARSEGIVWTIFTSLRPLLIDDYPAHPNADPLWVAAGIHKCFGVPVVAGGACLGSLGVFLYSADRSFDPRDMALVEMMGRQAGVALQNARLFEAARRRAAEAETLRQAASAVNSALEINAVLNKILEQLENVIPSDSSAIFLNEEDHLRIHAARGISNLAQLMRQEYSPQNPLFAEIDRTQAPVIVADSQLDSRFEHWGQATGRMHGWIGLPLRARDQRIGYLTVDSHLVDAYRQSDADLAQAFADEVAIALENARLFQQVQLLAITDPLTALYNRRYFFDAARREFERARRYRSPLGLILIDLDHFKRVNDTYGHLAGDHVLATVASRCKESLRDVDVAARYGGEEFIFLLPETDLAGAHLLAERLRERIMQQVVDTGTLRIAVSASMGVAEIDESCPDLNALVQRADQALYATKRNNRGAITDWTPDLAPAV